MVSVNPAGNPEYKEQIESHKHPEKNAKEINIYEKENTNYNDGKDVENGNVAPKKPLSANDLDCSSFGRKFKARAKDIAREAIEDVYKEIRTCNSKFGAFGMNTLPDIPDPTKYTKKGYGNKAEAFHAWSKDVEDWKEMILDNLENLQTQAQNTQHQQQMNAIYQLWARLGVTEQMLNTYCEQTNQNIESLKHVTMEKSTEIIQFVNNKVDNATYNINNHIETHVTENNFNTNPVQLPENGSEVDDSAPVEKNTPVDESKPNNPEQNVSDLRKQVYLSWNNDQNITKRALDHVLKKQGEKYERTHFTDGSQAESAAATSGIIENLDAETLQAVLDEVARLKDKNKDLLKHGLAGQLGIVGAGAQIAHKAGENLKDLVNPEE